MSDNRSLSSRRTDFHVDIYSDVVCPWCYVGLKRFEAALAFLDRQLDPEVTWRPFELNPTMPPSGMDRKVYLEAKFGSAGAVESLLGHVREAGRQSGLAFAFDRIARTPNTFDAHRLIWLAGREGRQGKVVERLFRAYFEEGLDLSHRPSLVLAASEAGLGQKDLTDWLASEEGVKEVRAEEQAGLLLGIRAVPYFWVAGQPGLSGAHPPPVIADWLRQAAMTAGASAPKAK
jgi:predicted DsbA family dithiol-disulfide isomerase